MRKSGLFVLFVLAIAAGVVRLAVAAAESKASLGNGAVDLRRYVGQWYEIARTYNRFEQGCVRDVTASYGLLQNGQVSVLDECRKKDRLVDLTHGKAKVADSQSNAKLRVTFFWPFCGDS